MKGQTRTRADTDRQTHTQPDTDRPGRTLSDTQIMDGSINLSLLHPTTTNVCHVSIAASLHQSFSWLCPVQAFLTIFRVLTQMLLITHVGLNKQAQTGTEKHTDRQIDADTQHGKNKKTNKNKQTKKTHYKQKTWEKLHNMRKSESYLGLLLK